MRAVLFDLDGTLADTIPLIVESMNEAVVPVIGRALSEQEVVALFGPIEVDMVRNVVGATHASEAAARFLRHYESGLERVSTYPGVRELLDALDDRGIPMGIVSGKGIDTARATLHALKLDHYFRIVLGGDCGFIAKPEPDCVLAATRYLGVEPAETLLVGDSRNDMISGRAAGTRVGLVAWDLHTGRLEELTPLADYVFTTPTAVLTVIDRQAGD
jgi:pyrophosphatase PpaX